MSEQQGDKPHPVKQKLHFDAVVRQTLSAQDVTVERAPARRRRTTTVFDDDPTDPIRRYDDDPTDPIRTLPLGVLSA